MKAYPPLLLLLGCLIAAGTPPSHAAGDFGLTPPKQLEDIPAWMPLDLPGLDDNARMVKLRARVDTDGRVVDAVAIEAVSMRLAEEALKAVMSIPFAPATEDGVPVQVVTLLVLQLQYRSTVETVTPQEHIQSRILNMQGQAPRYREVSAAELDSPIRLLESPDPVSVVDEDGRTLTGEVLIEFYIDHHGLVRLPQVVASSDSRLEAAAVQALTQARFAPPTAHALPVVTRVRLPMVFRAAGDESTG